MLSHNEPIANFVTNANNISVVTVWRKKTESKASPWREVFGVNNA